MLLVLFVVGVVLLGWVGLLVVGIVIVVGGVLLVCVGEVILSVEKVWFWKVCFVFRWWIYLGIWCGLVVWL